MLRSAIKALALLQMKGDLPLNALIETQVKHMVRGSTVVLITPSIFSNVALVVDFLLQRGLKPIVVLLDAFSFGGASGTDRLADSIKYLGVPYRIVRKDADLSLALSDSYTRS
jgi:hypothetical protein